MSNSQLNKLKWRIENRTEVILNLSSNLIGDSNNKANFPHKLLLTDREVSNIHKAFANNISANIKSSKTQLSQVVQLGWSISYLNLLDKLHGFKLMKPFIEEIGQNF